MMLAFPPAAAGGRTRAKCAAVTIDGLGDSWA
jgi:hypothetical protein